MSIKNRLTNRAAQILLLAGLTAPKRRNRGSLAIVTFHRVLPEEEREAYPYPGLVVTPQELDEFLAYFTAHYDCGALAPQHQRFLRGDYSTRPLLAITFDDGQYDNYLNARPILTRHQVKASFFIPVTAVERQELLWHDRLGFAVLALLTQEHGGRDRLIQILGNFALPSTGPHSLVENIAQESKQLDLEERLNLVDALAEAAGRAPAPAFARLMTFKEIADLAADGHEIGSHSMTHCMMPGCDDHSLTYELSESRKVLQAHIGQPIDSFCYPNGDSDARSASAVTNAGYLRAVTTNWGRNGLETDSYQLRRCDMDAGRVRDSNGAMMPALIAFRMSGFYPGLR